MTLHHFPEKWVYHLISASKVTTIHKVVGFLSESTLWCVELEVPQEFVGGLEVGTNCENFVDKILHTDDVVLAYNYKEH